MKKYLVYIFPWLLLMSAGCHKTAYPKPGEANDSYFYAKLLVNGQPLDLITGKDGYYMYSSYTMDSSNIYNLIGEFKQTGCGNCPNSLRIQVNDSKTSAANSSIMIDSALQVKNYNFLSGLNDAGYSVDFTGKFNKPDGVYVWDFGDGSPQESGYAPTHHFKKGKYKVALTITGSNMCQSVMVNTLSLVSANDLNVYVDVAAADSNSITFTAHASGGRAPYSYEWEYGDGTGDTTSNKTKQHIYNINIKGGYGVSLRVRDTDGQTTNCFYNAVAGNDLSACASNFSFSNISELPRRSGLSRVGISFTDANGITYTSDNSAQPQNSSFQIISVDEFVKNENNQAVKKLQLKFNCNLYNGTQSITLQGIEVHAGVAYK